MKLLIIEDDPRVVSAVENAAAAEGSHTVRHAADPERALEEAIRHKPDLILLDISLPGRDGRQLLQALKRDPATAPIPVIFLTGCASEGDKVLGLRLGADDYVVKPFGALELMARIQTVLRRSGSAGRGGVPGAGRRLSAGGLELDGEAREAAYKGMPLRLQPKEFEILYLLASSPGRPLTRSYLLENSSSGGLEASSRSLDTHIKNIRRKLGPGAKLIETVPKRGYRFAAPGA